MSRISSPLFSSLPLSPPLLRRMEYCKFALIVVLLSYVERCWSASCVVDSFTVKTDFDPKRVSPGLSKSYSSAPSVSLCGGFQKSLQYNAWLFQPLVVMLLDWVVQSVVWRRLWIFLLLHWTFDLNLGIFFPSRSMLANGMPSRRKTLRDSSSRTTSLPSTTLTMMAPWLLPPRAVSPSSGKFQTLLILRGVPMPLNMSAARLSSFI